MSQVKKIAFAGVFVALLIGSQFILSAVSGVEVVTVLLLSYCAFFGPWQGMAVASVFSFVRCLFFGFIPNVVVLYLIYYNLFALGFGFLGKLQEGRKPVWQYVWYTLSAVVSTVVFTFLDDLITPIFYGYTLSQMNIYFVASMPTMLVQCICTAVTVPCLLPGLLAIYRKIAFVK